METCDEGKWSGPRGVGRRSASFRYGEPSEEGIADAMAALVERWAAINSHSLNPKGLEKMLAELRRAFSTLDAKEELIDLCPKNIMGLSGQLQMYCLGRALRLYKRPEAPYRVLLGGHMDTVFPADSPFQTPKQLSENTLQGPGVADMKGGLVIMLKALEFFEHSQRSDALGWEVLITSDEELGSPSTRILWEEAAERCQTALLFEPALAGGSLVSERAASATFTLLASGSAAHSGRNPRQGRSAVLAIGEFLHAIKRLNEVWDAFYINAGTISGGIAPNIVPDRAACQLNIRADSDAAMASAQTELKSACNAIRDETSVQFSWHPVSARPHKPFDGKTQGLFEQLRSCAKELEMELSWEPSRGVCDGNFLGHLGVPTVDALGVCGGNLHSPQEYALLSTLLPRAKLTARFLEHLSRTGGAG